MIFLLGKYGTILYIYINGGKILYKKLYYGKINLNSHIFEVYEKKISFKYISDLIMQKFKEDIIYNRDDLLFTDDDGNDITYNAEYKVNYVNKLIDTNCIVGTIIKTSDLLANDIDEKTGEITKIAVPNKEIIKFFYDVNNELVCFSRTSRFGYAEFCKAFENILNNCMDIKGEECAFNVSVLREGIDMESIKTSLSRMKNIESLEVKITPPNPDKNLLGEIEDNAEDVIDSMKTGNITSKSILFTSKAPKGINLESKEIQDTISMAEKLHSKLSVTESTKKGYIEIDAKDKTGRIFTTKNTKPVTNYIDDRITGDHEFANICRGMIRGIINSLL